MSYQFPKNALSPKSPTMPELQSDMLARRQQNCGSFEYALIEAWFKADINNKRILEKAFENTRFKLTKS